MPTGSSTAAGDGEPLRLLTFHFTGPGAEPDEVPGLRSPVFEALREGERFAAVCPLYLPPWSGTSDAEGPRPLVDVLRACVAASDDEAERLLPDVAARYGRVVAERGEGALAIDAVGPDVLRELSMGTGAEAELAERLEERLPATGLVALPAPSTALRLHLHALRSVRAPHASRFDREVKHLARRLSDLLVTDDERAAQPAARAGTLGAAAPSLLDAERLVAARPDRGGLALDRARRARVEAALASLEKHTRADEPPWSVVHMGRIPDDLQLPGITMTATDTPLEMAREIFQSHLAARVEVLRAVRVARLEADGAYDPALHDAALAAFDADALTDDELLSLPAVVVVAPATRLRSVLFQQLSELLDSTEPIDVIAIDDAAHTTHFDGARSFADLGRLALGHGECFVLQSTFAEPEHLAAGLRRMAASTRPALAVVAAPDSAGPDAMATLLLAHAARALPCFCYDPDGGARWPQRFDIRGNPEPDSLWATVAVSFVDGSGTAHTERWPVTMADLVSGAPTMRPLVRVIPSEAWSDEQLTVPEFLELWQRGAQKRRIPYCWVRVGDELRRAVVPRSVAATVRDRARAWRWLQQLGGVDDDWARRAADEARQEAEQQAEARLAEMEARHAASLEEAKRSAVNAAMQRLAERLLDLDLDAPTTPVAPAGVPSGEPASGTDAEATAPAPLDPQPPEASEPTEPEPSPEPAPPPAAAEPPVLAEEASIDTPLCTSCNECTNINSRVFAYDDNKQAFIADATLGTYEELVRAAELCPARCIHPGTPRPDDETATPEVIARAQPFN